MTDTHNKGNHKEVRMTQAQDSTQEVDPSQEVDIEALVNMAEIVRVTHALDTKFRCERCNAQAYYEVQLRAGGDLYFCRHHYNEHKDGPKGLLVTASKIVDHEAFLNHQEQQFKGGTPVK